MKTLAAVLVECGRPLELMELDVPALQPGQVLVDVACSGVCRSQLMEVEGKRGADRYLPHLLGHEGAGRVLEVGDGVTKVRPGDHVVLGWIKGRGQDVRGPVYARGRARINAGAVTTFATRTIVSENRCVKIGTTFPLDVAALFGCAIPTGAGIVMHQLRPAEGATVAVFGLGGVGLSALMAINLYRCLFVVGVDRDEGKLALAREFGATHTVNSRREDVAAVVAQLTGGRGFDCAVEAAGTARSIETAFAAVRRSGGRCVFASHPPAGSRIRLDPYDLICGKRLEGSWGGGSRPDADIPTWARLYRRGKLPLEKMITRRFTLPEINAALQEAARGRTGRVMVEMRGGPDAPAAEKG